MAMMVTACPAALAAPSTRKGKRPLPAMRPRRILVVEEHFLGPPRRAPEDDTALRRADEVHQIVDLFAGQRSIPLYLEHRAARVQLELKQVAKRAFELADHFGRKAAAHQANRVQPENA